MILVDELELRECFHDDRVDYFQRIFSESFAKAHSLALQERYEAHRVALTFLTESFWPKNIKVWAPLVLEVMQLLYILVDHVACSKSVLAYIHCFCEGESGAQRGDRFLSHRFVEAIL